jgi:leucyl-tRNA synthetase
MLTRHLVHEGPQRADADGLGRSNSPAENAAKNGVPPAKWTDENIAYEAVADAARGLAIDWSREVATRDPTCRQVEPVAA